MFLFPVSVFSGSVLFSTTEMSGDIINGSVCNCLSLFTLWTNEQNLSSEQWVTLLQAFTYELNLQHLGMSKSGWYSVNKESICIVQGNTISHLDENLFTLYCRVLLLSALLSICWGFCITLLVLESSGNQLHDEFAHLKECRSEKEAHVIKMDRPGWENKQMYLHREALRFPWGDLNAISEEFVTGEHKRAEHHRHSK